VQAVKAQYVFNNPQAAKVGMLSKLIEVHEQINDYSQAYQHAKSYAVANHKILCDISVQYLHISFVVSLC